VVNVKKISGGGKVFDLRVFVWRWPPKLNNDMEFLLKAIIGGLIIAGVVTAAERGNPTVGALILGIPLASLVSIVFMHFSGVSPEVFSQLARETVYFVMVSLIFFPIFAYMVLSYGFWLSLLLSISVTLLALYTLLQYLK
jgi:uncharacterized membrane protein (GlpM family)